MIETNIKPGTPEWHAARCGIPTASLMSRIVTSTGEKSKQWENYLFQLATEKATGVRERKPVSYWMMHGKRYEPVAANLYEFHHDVVLRPANFCYMDEHRRCGFSPDRFIVGANAGLEIKCPAPSTHAKTYADGKLPTINAAQVYSSLYMSGFEYWDFMSFHPRLKPLYIRVLKTDSNYIRYAHALDSHLPRFLDALDTLANKLLIGGT